LKDVSPRPAQSMSKPTAVLKWNERYGFGLGKDYTNQWSQCSPNEFAPVEGDGWSPERKNKTAGSIVEMGLYTGRYVSEGALNEGKVS